MPSAKQLAQEYVPPEKMGNISELKTVSVYAEFCEKEFERKDGSKFSVTVYEENGKEYRVPVTVLKDLKVILEARPDLETFCVKKTGSTKDDTKYTVVALG